MRKLGVPRTSFTTLADCKPMKTRFFARRPLQFAVYLFTFLIIIVSGFSTAQAQVIESVNVKNLDDGAAIHIVFSKRMTYKAHTPVSRGDRLVVELMPVSGLGVDLTDNVRQNYPWKPTRAVPLAEVKFQQTSENLPTVTLRFTRSVRFKVGAAAGGNGLTVTLAGTANLSGPSTQSTGATEPSTVSATPSANSELRGAALATKMEQLMEQGGTAMVKHDYATAIQNYREVVQSPQNPQRKKAMEYLGLAQELDGRTDQARVTYERYLHEYPRDFSVVVKSFTSRTEAEQLARELETQDIRATVATTTVSGTPWYRVQITGFKNRKAAQQYADSIRETHGFTDAWLSASGDSTRVSQRITNLETLGQKPRQELRTPATTGAEDSTLNASYSGSFSNFYNHFALMTDRGVDVVESSVQADLFLSGQMQVDDWKIKAYFSGGQLIDTLGSNGPGSPTRITNGYMDLDHKPWGFNARLGRQNGVNGGVLGKFDGVNAGYMLNDRVRLNAVVGFPVEYTTVSRAGTDNFFYGVNADFLGIQGPLDATLDFNTFFIQQFVDGTQDRLAVGGEMRYFSDNINFFSLIDYDIMFNTLNILTFNGTWRFPTQTTANLLLDYRKAPIVTTSNALLFGQSISDYPVAPYNTLDQLLSSLSKDQVRDIAKSNSSDSYTGTVGFNHPLTERIQIGGDFTATRLNGVLPVQQTSIRDRDVIVDTSGIGGTGWEFFVSARMLANNMIVQGDLASVDFRYASLQSSSRYGLLLNTRYPLTEDFDLSPRFRVNYRYGYNGDNDWTFAPSLRMVYRFKRWLQFEAEAGSEFITGFIPDGNSSFTDGNYYVLIGYRIDFSGDF